MDLLKKEMERKKRALEEAKKQGAIIGNGRFIQSVAVRRIEEEGREIKRQKKEGKIDSARRVQAGEDENKRRETNRNKNALEPSLHSVKMGDNVLENMTESQITDLFRSMGLPVRIFGESSRLKRLDEALVLHKTALASLSEKDEFRLGQGHGIRNPFLEKMEEKTSKQGTVKGATQKSSQEAAIHDEPSDPHKRIYRYFKQLLDEWEDDLTRRPDDLKRSVAGKNETKTFRQCKDYIRPLFKLCKNRNLEEALMTNILKIVDFCEQGEFVKANDAYMDVAIGRAAWPIGVTMVGIHARTGRSKIESQNVAHVMNSELQRKYLTSVKRLISFAQSKRPDVDPSKKVMN